MIEVLFWGICAAAALFFFLFVWAFVEMFRDTHENTQPDDPTLNAFQQPMREKD